jgi:hypothetical protein
MAITSNWYFCCVADAYLGVNLASSYSSFIPEQVTSMNPYSMVISKYGALDLTLRGYPQQA